MTGAVARLLPCGQRLHLQHGPIDLIVGCDGHRAHAFAVAAERFESVLEDLVAELPLLRDPALPRPDGTIARRMYDAATPHADGQVTMMAAVAGAVAEEVLAAITAATPLSRAYVNNGGDIALHLGGDATFRLAMAHEGGGDLGRIEITAADPVRGIATSGRGGRSFSLGIADSVTVLAATAAQADVAATLIGNAVDLPDHPGIVREPARDLDPDSDLCGAPVVTRVGALTGAEVAQALEPGLARARALAGRGLIHGAALFLRGQSRVLNLPGQAIETTHRKTLTHA